MKLKHFQIFNYRNIHDSGIINVNDITAFVGQNEAGKSNLFEALYKVNPFDGNAKYNFDEDWPVDKWQDKDPESKVCEVTLELDTDEIDELFREAEPTPKEGEEAQNIDRPPELSLTFTSYHKNEKTYSFTEGTDELDSEKVAAWVNNHLPKFVYIRDYEMTGTQIELDALHARKSSVTWDKLSNDEQTILTILDLAKIDLEAIVKKGANKEGRTVRALDIKSASAYLSKKFQELWTQKDVSFELSIDHTTFNIFAQDSNVEMPVRLKNRSTGFRWYVSFAWKFTHASQGLFEDCILLLEEPGIHLHYSAQKDLIKIFNRLKESNTVLYTTHLASMVDLGQPEQIRIVESRDGHAAVREGVVSSQKAPMAVIEMALGLSGSMSGLLGNRKTLIVEGGDDALILHKLAGVLRDSGKESLSDSIYLWPAKSASKTPLYAGYAVGNEWDSGVLLDTDQAGNEAKNKIDELYLSKIASDSETKFRILQIGPAAGIDKNESAIEDLFPDTFYIELVNETFGVKLEERDLPEGGTEMISKRVEIAFKNRYSGMEFKKSKVTLTLLRRFDSWKKVEDLPEGTETKVTELFKKINSVFGV